MLFLFIIISKNEGKNYHSFTFCFIVVVAFAIASGSEREKSLTVIMYAAGSWPMPSWDQTIYHLRTFLAHATSAASFFYLWRGYTTNWWRPIFRHVQLNSTVFMFISENLITLFFRLRCGDGRNGWWWWCRCAGVCSTQQLFNQVNLLLFHHFIWHLLWAAKPTQAIHTFQHNNCAECVRVIFHFHLIAAGFHQHFAST